MKHKFSDKTIKGAMVLAIAFCFPFLGNGVNAALVPGGSVGPIVQSGLGKGFPNWYMDQNGLALELMEAADIFGISDPVDPDNPFSQELGFNAEGFWWSADAILENPHGKAILVLAMEAAFAGESAIDGEQSAFGRIRIRTDVGEPGTYTVKHPFGIKSYVINEIGPGAEINDTSDIGCFAIQGILSCDPDNPPNNPNNFGVALKSGIGPFLTWDSFDLDPTLTDPLLKNPDRPNKKYIGNPAFSHAVKGSPTGQNFFRIEGPNIGGPNINFIETDLFAVTGRIADINIQEEEELTSIVIDPSFSEVIAGDTIQFTATALNQFGNPMQTQPSFSWDSSDPSIGTLDNSGIFTALSEGTTDIAASANGITSNIASVVVLNPAPILTTISINPENPSMIIGERINFSASGFDQFGNPMDLTSVVWQLSQTGFGSFNRFNNSFAATKTGTVEIRATSGTINTATTITIKARPVLTSIEIGQYPAELNAGEKFQFNAAAFDQYGNQINANIFWRVDKPNVGSINARSGVFSAKKPGPAIITAFSGNKKTTEAIIVR